MKSIICCLFVLMVMVPFSIFAEEDGLKEMSYTVKKGDLPADILVVISKMSNTSISEILKWNPEMGLHNIFPGQKIRYYIQPGVKELLVGEIGKVVSLVDLNRGSITQLIRETTRTNGEIIKDLKSTRAEIRLNTSQTESGLKGINKTLGWLLWLIAGIFLLCIVIILITFIFFRGTRKNQQLLAQQRSYFDLEIDGQRYRFWPEINGDGRFMSLHQTPSGQLLCFWSLSDVAKSIKTSFRRNPELYQRELNTGKLKLLKEGGNK